MKYKTAIILCGGKGTRLGQIGKKLPKSLVKIHNLPIIYYILKSLKKNSFNHFILPLGYKGEQIKNYIKKNNFFKNYNIELINTGKDKPISNRIELVKKNILSLEISRKLEALKINSYSSPIKIGNNYLILKKNDIKEVAIKIDKKKELDKMVMIETSSQLDKFSNIFYNKIKLNSAISEF